jgi:hypothetical protein
MELVFKLFPGSFFSLFATDTYHVDELHECKPEANVDLLCHVLYGSDELVVAAEEIADESLLVFASGHWMVGDKGIFDYGDSVGGGKIYSPWQMLNIASTRSATISFADSIFEPLSWLLEPESS